MHDEQIIACLAFSWAILATVCRIVAWARWRRHVGGKSSVWGIVGSSLLVVALGTTLLVCLEAFHPGNDEALALFMIACFCSGVITDAVALVTATNRVAKPHVAERAKTVYHFIPLWFILLLFTAPVAVGLAAILQVIAWVRIVRRVKTPSAKLGAAAAMAHLVLLIAPFIGGALASEEMIEASLWLLVICLPAAPICFFRVAGHLGAESLRLPPDQRRRQEERNEVVW